MKRFVLLLAIIVATACCFMPLTTLDAESGSSTAVEVLGMPVFGVMSDRTCWLSLGMGRGVLFVGFLGAGVVALALGAAAGLLFGIGQAACGLIVVGQIGLGLVFALAQLGTGSAGLGQLIIGVLVKGQVGIGRDGEEFLKHLRDDLDKVLAFR